MNRAAFARPQALWTTTLTLARDRSRRRAGILRGTLWVGLFVGFAALRLAALSGVPAWGHADSPSYLEAGALSLDNRELWAGFRSPTLPLYFKLFGNNAEAITLGQVLIGLVAWTLLAAMTARALRAGWLKPLAFGGVLAFSLSRQIIQWDRLLLSESLSLSLFALLIAGGLWLFEGWRWHKALTLGLLALPWAFLRETNAYTLLLAALVVGAVVIARRKHWRYLVICLVFLALFGLNDWSSTLGRRWVFPALNVLGYRILTDPARSAFYVQEGMPLSPALQRLAGETANTAPIDVYSDPELEDFRRWFYAHGKQTYYKYLLAHPRSLVTEPFVALPSLLTASLDSYRPPELVAPLFGLPGAILFPTEPLLLDLWLLGGLTFAVLVAFRQRAPTVWALPLLLLLLAFPLLIIVWHGDPLEFWRHGLQVNVQLRLGVLLLVWFALDRRATRAEVAIPAAEGSPDQTPAAVA